MLNIYDSHTKQWNGLPLTFVNLMNAYLSMCTVMVPDTSAPVTEGVGYLYRQGRIIDVQLESGARMGTTPKHLLVKMDNGQMLYVRTED